MANARAQTQALQDMTLQQLLALFKGPPNTPVAITVSSSSHCQEGGDAVPARSPLISPPHDAVGGHRLVRDGQSPRSPPHTASPVFSARSSASFSQGQRSRETRTWGSGGERHENSNSWGEPFAAFERQQRRGAERVAENAEVEEIKVRLRGKAPIELGVDAWML